MQGGQLLATLYLHSLHGAPGTAALAGNILRQVRHSCAAAKNCMIVAATDVAPKPKM